MIFTGPQRVHCQKGDTLWDISKTIYGDMQDAREMVYLMMKINNIEDLELQPGWVAVTN